METTRDPRQRIVTALKASGRTQKEIARRVGVSQQAVSFWFSGRQLPDVSRLRMLGRAYPELLPMILDVIMGDDCPE